MEIRLRVLEGRRTRLQERLDRVQNELAMTQKEVDRYAAELQRHGVESVEREVTLSGVPDFKHFDRWFALTNRLRTEGTENLLAAAKASGVKRFVAQSFTGWSNSREGRWIKTEDDPLDPHPVKEQRETLAAITFLERAVLEAPLDGIVVRYGGLYGPGSSEKLVEILRRMFPVIGDGAGMISSTHIDDAAGGTLAALERGRRGIYNIVDDDPARAREFIPAIAEAVGAPSRSTSRPGWPGCSRARSR